MLKQLFHQKFYMSDNPENEKRGAFIRKLIDIKDILFRNTNADSIPVSRVAKQIY